MDIKCLIELKVLLSVSKLNSSTENGSRVVDSCPNSQFMPIFSRSINFYATVINVYISIIIFSSLISRKSFGSGLSF